MYNEECGRMVEHEQSSTAMIPSKTSNMSPHLECTVEKGQWSLRVKPGSVLSTTRLDVDCTETGIRNPDKALAVKLGGSDSTRLVESIMGAFTHVCVTGSSAGSLATSSPLPSLRVSGSFNVSQEPPAKNSGPMCRQKRNRCLDGKSLVDHSGDWSSFTCRTHPGVL